MTGDGLVCVVLAGGRARRFGSDKLAAPLHGTTVLAQTLAGLPDDAAVVCVGPERPTARAVVWTREPQPYSGPVAAVAAGVDAIPEIPAAGDRFGSPPAWVAVVAGDLPRAGSALAALLAALDRDPDASVAALSNAAGRLDPLLAVWRLPALRQRLAEIGDPRDRAALALLDVEPGSLVVVADAWEAGVDVDTPDALRRTDDTPRPRREAGTEPGDDPA